MTNYLLKSKIILELTAKGAENLEKTLESIKKDLKKLQGFKDALNKKRWYYFCSYYKLEKNWYKRS